MTRRANKESAIVQLAIVQLVSAQLAKAPLVSVHIATVLFGLAGVLGASVGLNAIEVTFGRTLFASLALAVVCLAIKAPLRLHLKSVDSRLLLFSGVLLAFHWVVFFASIQYSTVAIGLVTFSTCPVFVSLLEPVFYKERLSPAAVLAAILVMVGVVVISGVHSGELVYVEGIALGIIGGLSFALLQLLNRRLASSDGALVTSLVQSCVAALLLLPIVFTGLGAIKSHQWLLLMILGVACTAIAYTLFIAALKRLKVSTASLIAAGLEPVYGVVLAMIILSQKPEMHVLIGGAIILATVVMVTMQKKPPQGL